MRAVVRRGEDIAELASVQVTGALTRYDAARSALAEAKRVDEVMGIRDEAERLRLYARQAKDRDLMADAMEIQLRAERRLGEMIQASKEAGQIDRGGRPTKEKTSTEPEEVSRFRLAEAGIDHKLSARAQQVAKLDDAHFDAIVDRSRTKILSGNAVVVNPMRDLTQDEKRDRRNDREAELGAKQLALPEKKYGVIYADPEWRFEPYSRETGMDRAADNHYPTSATLDIVTRPVAEIAARDCVLFLWATAPMLQAALAVMTGWGFAYKSHYIWGKDGIGTGYWMREKHELLLIGTRGRIDAPAMGDQAESLIMAPRAEHSAKPEIFAAMIERWFPSLPKIELNRRGSPRPGWSAWGNEVEESREPSNGDVSAGGEAWADGAPRGHRLAAQAVAMPEPADREGNAKGTGGAKAPAGNANGSPSPIATGDDDLTLPAVLDRRNWIDGRPPVPLPATIGGERLAEGPAQPLEAVEATPSAAPHPASPREGRGEENNADAASREAELAAMEAIISGDWAAHMRAIEALAARKLVRTKKQGFALPDDLDTLSLLYGEAIGAYDAAIVSGRAETIAGAAAVMDLIVVKANGGTHFGCLVNEGPCRIKARNRAPPGQVPLWGQDGRFIASAGGVTAIVARDGSHWEIYATRFNQLFPSETGFESCFGFDDEDRGLSVAEFALVIIRRAIAYRTVRKINPFAAGLSYPERVYRLGTDEAVERGVVIGPGAPGFAWAALLAFFDAWNADRLSGEKKRTRKCPAGPHGNIRIAAIQGGLMERVGDFPISGSYVVETGYRADGEDRVLRYVADAERLDRPDATAAPGELTPTPDT